MWCEYCRLRLLLLRPTYAESNGSKYPLSANHEWNWHKIRFEAFIIFFMNGLAACWSLASSVNVWVAACCECCVDVCWMMVGGGAFETHGRLRVCVWYAWDTHTHTVCSMCEYRISYLMWMVDVFLLCRGASECARGCTSNDIPIWTSSTDGNIHTRVRKLYRESGALR